MNENLIPRVVAEFIGTFALLFAGAGTAAALVGVATAPSANLVAIALAHGLVIGLMVAAVWHISGAHFNPAVTLGMLVTGRIRALTAVFYWLAQLAGAVVAVLLLRAVIPQGAHRLKLSLLEPGVNVAPLDAMVVEAVITFFLVWVIFGTLVDSRSAFKSAGPLAVGAAYAVGIFAASLLTGGALNPARSLGPEIVLGKFGDWWIYVAGPFFGAVIGALLYEYLVLDQVHDDKKA
jgi:aquaporin Z